MHFYLRHGLYRIIAWVIAGIVVFQTGGTAQSSAPMTPSNLRPSLDLQLGHGGWVRAVAFSPDGQTLVSGSSNAIKFWDVRSGELTRTFDPGHWVHALAFSPDGSTLASAGGLWEGFWAAPGEIKLWDARTGRLKLTLTGHKDIVMAVAFAPDGKTIASGGGNDKTARLWDAATGNLQHELTGLKDAVNAVAFSPDGKTLAVGSGSLEAPAPEDNEVTIWDVRTGRLERALKGKFSAVITVAYAPDGKLLALGSRDRAIRIIDAQTGEQRLLLKVAGAHDPGWVHSVTFAPDGNTIASAYDDDTVRLWNAHTAALKHELKGQATSQFLTVRSVSFSPDGKLVASGGMDNIVRLWNVDTGVPRVLGTSRNPVESVAYAPNGKVLASGSGDKSVRLWDTRTGELLRTLTGHSDRVIALTFSPDGKTLAAGVSSVEDWDAHEIRLWDVATGQLKHVLNGHTSLIMSLAFSPDGSTLISGSWDKSIKLWDVRTGKLRSTLTGHSLPITSISLSPDGKTLASGAGNPWDEKEKEIFELWLWDVATGTVRNKLNGHQGWVWAVAFSPDGHTLASGGKDKTIHLWDSATGTATRTLSGHKNPVGTITFSPDGRLLASGDREDTIRVWEAHSGKLLKAFRHSSGWSGSWLAFAPDSKTLASSTFEGLVHFWEPGSGRLLASLLDLPATSTPRPITADGKPITADAKALAVNAKAITADAKPITADAKDPTASEQYLVFTPEGYYAGSAAADRYVRFRLNDTLYPAESFQTRYYRPDLVRQALAQKELPPAGLWKGVYPPLVGFTSAPTVQAASDSFKVSLNAADDSDIKTIICLINGARVDARVVASATKPITAGSKPITADGKMIPGAHRVLKSFTIELPLPAVPAIKLQVIAVDDDDLHSPREEILFTRDLVATPTGKLLGLCVGVSRYEDTRLNLKYADRDAMELAQSLNGQRGIYSAARVDSLTNEQATRANLEGALKKLVGRAGKTDTVILLFSGHGWRSDERNFYFATHEVQRQNVGDTALPWQHVVESLTQLSRKSKRVIVLLDACYSGSAATNEDLVKALLAANAGVMVFASSKGTEVSLELPDYQHGAFTEALLEALSGKVADMDEKDVSLWDFTSYVRHRVKQLTENAQNPQVPFLQDFDTDAPIVSLPPKRQQVEPNK